MSFFWLVACAILDPASEVGKDQMSDSGRQEDTGCTLVFEVPDLCNGMDDDCDGVVDENPELSWYADEDLDGFGTGELISGCEQPITSAQVDGDCDDTLSQVNPEALEICDGHDNDCDGYVDPPDSVDAPTWYRDVDGDGYGSEDWEPIVHCDQPSGYVSEAGDCNEGDTSIHPYASEVCLNEIDDDCDGQTDEHCIVQHCGAITQSESWIDTRVHQITCDVEVGGSASPVLTIEKGAVVWFDDDTALKIAESEPGSVVVEGSSSERVTLTSTRDWKLQPWSGVWMGVYVGAFDAGSSFQGMDLAWAGGNGTGGLVVDEARVSIVDCSFKENTGYGVSLSENSGLDDWSANTLSGNTWPMTLSALHAEHLDSGSTYSPNADDYVFLIGSQIGQDVTLEAIDAAYVFEGDVSFGSPQGLTVTVKDGATVLFERNASWSFGLVEESTLIADGSTQGITFGSADKQQAGEWKGLTFGENDSGSELIGVTVEYGGGNDHGCIEIDGSSLVIADSTIQNCKNNGIYLGSGSLDLNGSTLQDNQFHGIEVMENAVLSSLSGSTITGSGSEPIRLPPDSMGAITADCSMTGNGEDLIDVLGGSVTSDASWAAVDVSWKLSGDLVIEGGSTVTVEDGVELLFDPQTGLSVENGTLAVDGTSSGVTFGSSESQPALGDWTGLQVGEDGSAELEGLTLVHAGFAGAGIRSQGALEMSDCSLSEIDASCVSVSGGSFTATGNTLEYCTGYPVELPADLVDGLDGSNSLSGNGTSLVLVEGGTVSTDLSWGPADVEWMVSEDIEVGSGALLTIEEGTFINFDGAALRVGTSSSGGLAIEGGSSSPVILNGDPLNPSAGDWVGIELGPSCDTTSTALEWVDVLYGGKDGTGNIALDSCDASLSNVVLSDSAAWGLYTQSSNPTLTNVSYQNNSYGDTN